MIIKEAVENMTAFENDKVKELFEACDLDASGYIDQYELAAVVDLDPDDLREIFSQLDRDGDGKISIEDFTDNYKRFANLATQVDKRHITAEPKANNQPLAATSPSHRQPEKLSPRRRSEPRLSRSLDSSLSDRNLKYMIKDAGGQEYLEQIYEAIASSNNPDLLAALEKFVSSQIDAVQQRNADNERLDQALRRATEKNSEMARHLEEEMEQQMLTLESRIRDEERRKAERMLLEAHWKIEAKAKELQSMNEKLEATLQLAEGEDDDELKREIEDKIDENINLQSQLREYQTQMAVMRSEMASLKSEYDEQSERLNRERQTVLQCVQEQENLTRQLHLLHEANKKLHDTNDDLRAALETKRSGRSPSPLKRSMSFTSPRNYHRKHNIYSSRTDFDDQSSEISSTATSPPLIDDEISAARPANHQPYGDEDDVNEASLMSELLAADEKAFQSAAKLQDDDDETYGAIPKPERENFLKQLEILCETNKRLSQSNDELRNALAIVADQVKKNNKKPKNSLQASSSNSDYASGQGSRSESPPRENNEMDAPQSTSSPVKAVSSLEKLSQYARRGSDEEFDEDDMEDDELAKLVEMTSGSDSEVEVPENVTIEEVRGTAVGADAPPSERSIQSYSPSPNVDPERMYKLVLAGDAAVGKSSFIIRLCKGKFYTALNSTLGVDFQVKTLTVDNHVVALQLWDTAGQERFRSIAKSYFRKVDGVILLYDVTCETSFKDVRGWLESIEESAQKPVPVIICGNKTDLRPEMKARGERVIAREEGERLANEVGALFIETSAKDGSNIAETCVKLARKLYKNEDNEVQNGGMKLQEETKAEAKKKSSCCK